MEFPFSQETLLKFGNELEISGVYFANATTGILIPLPDCEYLSGSRVQGLDLEGWKVLLNQLDNLYIQGLDKTILRKSQRNIEQNISWNVYRRDHYKCRYCGRDDVALTVDHIILWEAMGASTEDNLISACRKCNKTRGNMEYDEWLTSPYYMKVSSNLTPLELSYNTEAAEIAERSALRNTQRSR